jgi:hypothetical protein
MVKWNKGRNMHAEKDIEAYVIELRTEVDRYYYTVHLMIGLRDHFVQNRAVGFEFVSSGRTMTTTRNDGEEISKPRPDIILQSLDGKKGILIELKPAYSPWESTFEYQIKEVTEQLGAFDRNVIGWATTSGSVDEYCIVLLPYHEDATIRVPEYLQSKMKLGEFVLTHPFAVWFWSVDRSQRSVGDIIKIFKSELGKDVGWNIGSYLDGKMITIRFDQLFSKYDEDKFRFARDPPGNNIYTIIEIYNVMSPILRKPPDKRLICTVDEIMELAETYLPSWLPDDGKPSQLKVEWVRKALDTLVQVGLAVRKEDSDAYEWIEPQKKNFTEELYGRVAKLQLKKDKYASLTSKREESGLMTLNDY